MKRAIGYSAIHGRWAPAAILPAMLLAILFSSHPLRAQALSRQVNLAYLVKRADIIVQGQIVSVKEESLPGYPNIPTVRVTLNVQSMMRGSAGTTYTFREILLGLRSSARRKVNYQIGQQVFLFLPTPSEIGLSSPVGMEQGRFRIARNPDGSAMIVNELGNAGLFRNVAQAVGDEGLKLTPSQQRLAATERGPVKLDEFSFLVKSLTALKRIQ